MRENGEYSPADVIFNQHASKAPDMRCPYSVTFLLPILVTACATGPAPEPVPPGEQIGQPIKGQAIEALSSVQADPAAHFKKTLLVEAKVKAVCQKMGCWMQIVDSGQPALVRWSTGCGGKFAFPKDAAGERILIQGSFYPKEIKPEDAEHLKAEAGQDLDIPAKGYEFNATGVVMLDRVKSH